MECIRAESAKYLKDRRSPSEDSQQKPALKARNISAEGFALG
jgi:hypothetical protein